MNKHDLLELTKSQLINILLKQDLEIKQFQSKNVKQQPKNDNIILPPPEFRDDYKPIPKPRKSVKQMVMDYEDNIILPPLEFRDDYKPTPKPRTKKPIPTSRTKIEQVDKALKGYTKLV